MHSERNEGYAGEPLIPLLDTTLLTNAPGEPRVGQQIHTEIHSADRIDVVMAFYPKDWHPSASRRPEATRHCASMKATSFKRLRAGASRRKTSQEILLLEDNATAAERRSQVGVGSGRAGKTITVRVHCFRGSKKIGATRKTYDAGSMRSKRSSRVDLALHLLDRSAKATTSIVVAGTSYGSTAAFLDVLLARGFHFVVQIRPSTVVNLGTKGLVSLQAGELLNRGHWTALNTVMPDGRQLDCAAAQLGDVAMPGGRARLFAAQIGGIHGIHRGTIIGLASFDASLSELVRLVSYTRWIRGAIRRKARQANGFVGAEPTGAASTLTTRANIAHAIRQDARAHASPPPRHPSPTGQLGRISPVLNVVELFSGAGGMGLGFLLGGGKRGRHHIVYSGEANPIFVDTLRRNHATFERVRRNGSGLRTPELTNPVDLRRSSALPEAAAVASEAGGAHVLIGGPPCQGFSMANRNSSSGNNPHNELVDVFLKYVRTLRPLVFLMENVQGILWTPNGGTSVSVVDVIERRMRAAGYVVFPKLLDAVWYGAPQHRTRFFLMGLHQDLGYGADSFGAWGPFPLPTHGGGGRPLVTVRDAIADLPRITNGASAEEVDYANPSRRDLLRNPFLQYVREGAERNVVFDHVTSRHADYVIDRYRRIPAGGNWESIQGDLTNYADVSRTHSNIYRRLRWNEPSITIGHYRKSMLVHPRQTRGLSLREAARLQSFPDWFRFSGSINGASGGLVHKQQQLANAVCPLVTKAVAEFILRL